MRDEFDHALAPDPVRANVDRVRVPLAEDNRMARAAYRAALHGSDMTQAVTQTGDEEEAVARYAEDVMDVVVLAPAPNAEPEWNVITIPNGETAA